MGVYIKGMKIPTEEYGPMTIKVYPNGHVAEYIGDIGRVWDAVPVPPHGRLVDADAIRAGIDEKRPGRSYEDAWALTIMDAAPTVLEAEEV